MHGAEHLQPACESCDHRGLLIPSTVELDRIPENVVLGAETRWLLLREGRLWIALPRRMDVFEACVALREETGALWLARCSICILLDSQDEPGSAYGGSFLFGSRAQTYLQQLRLAGDRDEIAVNLDRSLMRHIRRFDDQASARAHRTKVLREFLGMLQVEERWSFSLLLAPAARERDTEAAGMRLLPSGIKRRRGRPVSRPILNELVRFVAGVCRRADQDAPRKNLWAFVAAVARPYIFFDRRWERRRLSDEAVRQILKHARVG